LVDLGVKTIQRETFLSALDTTRQVLKGLGYSERVTERTIATFRTHDERRLSEDYMHYTDVEKMQEKARGDTATLEKLVAGYEIEEAKQAAATATAAKEWAR
jgi:glutathione-regulated potassium-efflux system protein KefB